MMVDEVSVPSRGFGSDDLSPLIPHKWSEKFPSPLGVLGLTTQKRGRHAACPNVVFPSPLGVLGLTTSRTICSSPGSMRFPSPLGVLGLTTRADHPHHTERVGASFRPLSGFWV